MRRLITVVIATAIFFLFADLALAADRHGIPKDGQAQGRPSCCSSTRDAGLGNLH